MKAVFIPRIVPIIIGFSVLTSYSGQWEVFTCKNDVRDIALSGNTLWAATTGGVVAWNLVDNSYKCYTTLNGLISCDINQVAIDKKGRPWVATKKPAGLYVYENHKWKQINVGGADYEIEGKIISNLEIDQFGNVWVYIKYDKHLWRYDGQKWYKNKGVYGPLALDLQKNLLAVDSLYSALKKIKFSLTQQAFVKQMLRADNTSPDTLRFRIVSFNGSEFVSKWQSKIHNEFYIFALAHIALDSSGKYFGGCNALFIDKSGIVWSHSKNGIARFDGISWKLFESAAVSLDLPYSSYSHIIQDKSGTMWFGTEGSGLLAYNDNRWRQFTTRDGLPHNSIRSLALDSRYNL